MWQKIEKHSLKSQEIGNSYKISISGRVPVLKFWALSLGVLIISFFNPGSWRWPNTQHQTGEMRYTEVYQSGIPTSWGAGHLCHSGPHRGFTQEESEQARLWVAGFVVVRE